MKVIALCKNFSTQKSKKRIMVFADRVLTVDWDGVECFSTEEHGMGTFFQKENFSPIEKVKPIINLKFTDKTALPPGNYSVKIESVKVEQVGDVSKCEATGVKISMDFSAIQKRELALIQQNRFKGETPEEYQKRQLAMFGQQFGRGLRITSNNQELTKEVKTMNTGAALFAAVSDNFVTIECKFRDANQKTYTYKAKKSDSIMVGDIVVVLTPANGYVIVDVVAVHNTPQFTPGINYRWIVQRVDNKAYQEQLVLEAVLTAAAEQEARQVQRKTTLKVLKKAYPEGSEVRTILEKYVL